MGDLAPFERRFFDPERRQSRIGDGVSGGKAEGLVVAREVTLAHREELEACEFDVDVPALVVIGAGVFERFLDRNGLRSLVEEHPPEPELAQAFARASLPAEFLGDLRALSEGVRVPLAVRSSSVLEDALGRPFAGVYGTKMIPAPVTAGARFRALGDAIRFVYASAFLAEARAYMRATGHSETDERMAVVVQEVVGRPHDGRFYPDISGVARSFDFYPLGPARPEDGVAHVALGLGKTIVDGGVCWPFCPTHPTARPPFGSPQELLAMTQTRFWAVNMGPPPPHDPMSETEHLVACRLTAAESDGTLRSCASTWDSASDRVVAGISRQGPRVLDFAPILVERELRLAELLERLLPLCAEAVGAPVEIEFAISIAPHARPRFGLLQVRPLRASEEPVDVSAEDVRSPAALFGTAHALGNGRREVEDVLYVDPASFVAAETRAIATEIETLNARLIAEKRRCLLIGLGRWGSSDHWLGIPVRWDQIASAAGLVEAATASFRPEPSQGSHFFHNLSSFGVLYYTVSVDAPRAVDWAWLDRQEVVERTTHVKHVRTKSPLLLAVDGRSRRGLVLRSSDE